MNKIKSLLKLSAIILALSFLSFGLTDDAGAFYSNEDISHDYMCSQFSEDMTEWVTVKLGLNNIQKKNLKNFQKEYHKKLMEVRNSEITIKNQTMALQNKGVFHEQKYDESVSIYDKKLKELKELSFRNMKNFYDALNENQKNLFDQKKIYS